MGTVAARRPVALVAAVVLILEAGGIVLLNWILSIVVDRQQMSLAGLRPGAMTTGALAAGAVAALSLLGCAALLLRTGLRDRPPGTLARIALICCAVVHAVLGAFVVGMVGWLAFAALLAVLALLVLTLVAYGERPAVPDAGADAEPDGPAPAAPTSA
ncbi:hypothetical protein FNJ62_11765 [Streptomyces benahoarensis]|uniref:Uncharacterized protein n=1 Tax=Streptomyces benahoarensis TaxID=2595054 RepID=A0A553ZLZ3_9ACTN|nr:hypothetical protein [Streptomyces benahoarensis]TSB25906.1 hypothetical protein FNJ62_11765 [Streptomyces benahoarensis]TSB42405.1 hypothetical protein FNZ23_10065 [Streptomyces benahoarensis]